MTFQVQHTEEYPTANLLFVKIDGKVMLHQKWKIFEWGNEEGLGQPMNVREEWRIIPIGELSYD